ncbi:unnamed protein product [Hydatigera taeniaeformis]|uniref:J domain-containing protein n=1 Tax=Hydatigena taeniaeformis TaxID=6205 RepID=A0A0R3WQH3_HYDTA|nr:unnamed protein product [Hydatigera taeniaeformis]
MADIIQVDIYEYLGISFESSAKEIKRAYKNKAKELHPDKNKSDPQAKEKFQKLKEYYDILQDPKLKIAAAERHAQLDGERRRLKEALEAKEREAAARRKEVDIMVQNEKTAQRIRKEWEDYKEATVYANRDARFEIKKSTRFGGHVVVSVRPFN